VSDWMPGSRGPVVISSTISTGENEKFLTAYTKKEL
jgi:hypothetical protein